MIEKVREGGGEREEERGRRREGGGEREEERGRKTRYPRSLTL